MNILTPSHEWGVRGEREASSLSVFIIVLLPLARVIGLNRTGAGDLNREEASQTFLEEKEDRGGLGLAAEDSKQRPEGQKNISESVYETPGFRARLGLPREREKVCRKTKGGGERGREPN